MNLSLKDFSEKFLNDFLEIHWKQWAALGVATYVKPEKYWIVDLESIIISSLLIGLRDKRLLSASLEWLIKNGEWVNRSRLKRIGKAFIKPFPQFNEPLLSAEIFKLMSETLQKFGFNTISIKWFDSIESNRSKINEYLSFFNKFEIKGKVTKPQIQQPSLLQLQLRGLFGVDAHVEVFVYLLINNSGNSNSISKEIFYDQKNVYKILEKWTKANIVTKVIGKKTGEYSLERKKIWLSILGLKNYPGYLNWIKTLLLLNHLANALSTPPWSKDEYLISSLFRDILTETKSLGKSLNVQVPESDSFPGSQYFTPFATSILNILEKLKGQ